MSAITRWIEYGVSAAGSYGDGDNAYVGTRASCLATATPASPSTVDTFTITSANNTLYFTMDGLAEYITLTSGSAIDARCVAREITEKIHNLGKNLPEFDNAICAYENGALKLYSGSTGSGASVTVVTGTNTAHLSLGWGTKDEVSGAASTNTYTGAMSVSGTYSGFFDETYTIIINKEYNVGVAVKSGDNNYTGTSTTAGVFNSDADITYTLVIDCTNGTTMGGGTGNVPTLAWTSTSNYDNSAAPIELLFPNFWYKLGTRGALIKFTDAVFNTCTAYTVACTYPVYVNGTNPTNYVGSAMYICGSDRGDTNFSGLRGTAVTTVSGGWSQLGTRGLYISFAGGTGVMEAGDTFTVICRPPQPSNTNNVTNLNYGNVTVSTESAIKCVAFEILSGAVEIGSVKFGLQSHGTFSHHNAGNSDTLFRWGTVGPGNPAGTAPINGLEWRANVIASDLANDVPPAYLYATDDNLPVAGDADSSKSIGASCFGGMLSDPIWLNIKLGNSEVGANSTITYRCYFDYS